MKKLIIFMMLLICAVSLNAQIDLSNVKKVIKPVEYDSSYIVPDYLITQEMKSGLIGQSITILEITDIGFKTINGYYGYGSTKDLATIKNNKWKIVDYTDNDVKISNDSTEYIINSYSTKFFINGGLKKLQNNIIGKSYFSFSKEIKITSVDNVEYTLNGDSLLNISDIQYAKLKNDFGVVIFFKNGLIVKLSDNDLQPDKKGWISITSINKDNLSDFGDYLLVEKNVMKSFIVSNGAFINKMRDGKIAIGMTEYQTRLAWGMPTTSYKNVAGYSKVNVYGDISNSQNLYFQNSILKLIK